MEQRNATEESHFYWLYMQILDYIKNRERISDEEIGSGIRQIIGSFRYDRGHQFSDVDMRYPSNICAYLFRYGPHGAGLVRSRVLEAARYCQAIGNLMRRRRLRVVSLGGGPANDVVGFCSVLRERQLAPISLQVTVVDKIDQWSESVELVERLVLQQYFGNVSDVFQQDEASLDFVQANLPGNPLKDEICYLALEDADVILVSKLLSVMEWSQKARFVKNLYLTVSDQALILLIDSPFEHQLWYQFDVLYLSQAEQPYQMSELHERFGMSDNVQSKSRIAVLSKRC